MENQETKDKLFKIATEAFEATAKLEYAKQLILNLSDCFDTTEVKIDKSRISEFPNMAFGYICEAIDILEPIAMNE